MKKTKDTQKVLNNSGLRGYRLHDARIAYSSGKESMRSIKYELVSQDDAPKLSATIADLVVSDHRYLYGNINLNDYLTWRTDISDQDFQHGKREASFLGLWVKALSLGFIFSKQKERLLTDFNKLNHLPTPGELSYKLLSEGWKKHIDQDKWIKWWASTKKPSKIDNIFKKDSLNSSRAKRVIDLYNQISAKKTKLEFRCELFQLPLEKLAKNNCELQAKVAWSCLPDFPAEQFAKLTDWTEILDRIIAYYESKGVNMSPEGDGPRYLGLYDGQNRIYAVLGNFFNFLKHEDLAKHSDNLAKVFNFSKEQKQIIQTRLELLREYVKPLPEKPHLARSWSEYRGVFGGMLESWYSNRVSKQNDTKTQLINLRQLLAELLQVLTKHSIEFPLISQAINFIDSQSKMIDRAFTLELDSFLAEIRSSLNETSQKNPELNQDLGKITFKKSSDKDAPSKIFWQKELSRRLQTSPLFFGENKRLLWEEVYQLKNLINHELDQLLSIFESPIPEQVITDKQVDMLAQLFQRIKTQGNPKVLSSLKTISHLLATNFEERDDTHRYYISKYSNYQQERAKQLKFEPVPLNILINSIDLPSLLKVAKLNPESNFILRDVVGLSKVLVSAIVAEKDPDFRRQIVKTHSNLQGYSALISKQQFISRYTIQSINGEQCVLATALAQTKKGIPTERYFYAFKYVNDLPEKTLIKISNASPAHYPEEIAEPKKSNNFTALEVRSSRYQVQFLDWFFGKHSKKQTQLKAGGAFTITEQLINLNWAKTHPETSIKNKRLFVSQPFTLCPLNTLPPKTKLDRFIGVDIGEYGLAWSLIQVESDTVQQLDSGFIADPQQQKLKKAVSSLRENQAKQTFTSPNTRIARLRESLIGTYRNELAALSLKHHARLSFEYEVDAFESGGNRISKIYSSIKRSFVYRKENEPDIKLAFGSNPFTKTKNPDAFRRFNLINGFETTAAGTSRFCTKCLRWADLAINKTDKYQLSTYDDRLFKIKTAAGEVRLLGKLGQKAGDSITGQEATRLIYKAMRPNEDGLGFRIVERHPSFMNIKQSFGKNKPRGNIGVFVCPYTDCHHITDADLQAAFSIAIRGYLKSKWQEKYTTDKARKNNPLSKEVLTEATAKLKFPPISSFGLPPSL